MRLPWKKPKSLKPSDNTPETQYVEIYEKIKVRCHWQQNFSLANFVLFFFLQYSVPILLVVLGSVTSSREQIEGMFQSPSSSQQSGTSQQSGNNTSLASKIIYLIGLFTIMLGVVNNIVRPAESYDVAGRYNNRFYEFEYALDLEFLRLTTIARNSPDSKESVTAITKFLLEQNTKLSDLIAEYYEARSISPNRNSQQAVGQSQPQNELLEVDERKGYSSNGDGESNAANGDRFDISVERTGSASKKCGIDNQVIPTTRGDHL